MYVPQCRKRILIHVLILFTDNEVPDYWKSNPKDHPLLKSGHMLPADRANKSQVADGTLKILFENVLAVLEYHLPAKASPAIALLEMELEQIAHVQGFLL